MPDERQNLEQLVDRVEDRSRRGDEVALRDVVESLGRRSFGPLLLLPGLVTLSPLIGDIPGMPTLMGVFVILVCGQLVLGCKQFWFPNWLLARSVSSEKLRKVVRALRRPARAVDHVLKPRLCALTGAAATSMVAWASLIIGAAMPLMEVVAFSANLAGVALTAFGLALITRDGLLALLAIVFTSATVGLAADALL